MRLKVIISLLLAGITMALYWPARHFSFVYYDDEYFILCQQVATGFSPIGIEWVLKGFVVANWHPITTFSFLLMHEFFGLNPGAEHVVNILFHAANAVLLFLVLVELVSPRSRVPSPGSGFVWCCAMVAGVFAWHPLHVGSVAWISERKDVLFTFFMLLSLWCYALYAKQSSESTVQSLARPHSGRLLTSSPSQSLVTSAPTGEKSPSPFLSGHGYYNLALLFFILSLLSKAMVVTLPFLLLLLDYWPLQRLNRSTLRSLIFDKWRFFALSAIFCVITFWIQKSQGAVVSLEKVGWLTRFENAILSYVKYLGELFWPGKLAVIYPLPSNFDSLHVLLAALLLLAISAFCILQMSRRPYLIVGWFWYLGTMVPIIGLVQINAQAMADHFTYITLIGPVLALVWLVGEPAFAKASARQGAREHSFGKYAAMGAAAAVLVVCVVLTERQLQFWRDTVTLFTRTIAVTPENGIAEYTLALGLEHEGLLRQAAVHYQMAITEHPDSYHFQAHFYLAELRAKAGFYQDAEAHLEAALKINPNSTDAMNNLAWTLATCPDAKARDGARAVQWAERACELTYDENTLYLSTLAAAYAEAGRFDDAVATTQKAIALANEYGLDSLAEANQELLQTYSAHQTYAQTHR